MELAIILFNIFFWGKATKPIDGEFLMILKKGIAMF